MDSTGYEVPGRLPIWAQAGAVPAKNMTNNKAAGESGETVNYLLKTKIWLHFSRFLSGIPHAASQRCLHQR